MQGAILQSNRVQATRTIMTDEEKPYAIGVSLVSSPGINDVWNMISEHMPSQIYEILSAKGMTSAQDYITVAYPPDPLDAARKIIINTDAASIRVVTYWDDAYPPLLREIQRPPLVLYLKGELNVDRAVAVVGTRKSDMRSSMHARRIAWDLGLAGFTVVSGMALGIDREAHLGALDANGRTVGVLANGIDIVYPSANRDLYRRIHSTSGSALVSEYPPGIRAGKWTFLRRNRIISGLCPGTVVVKAGERSGALITARHAIDQNREVFVCVGNTFDEEYAGCHELIRSGAILVSKSDDIINELSRGTGCPSVPDLDRKPFVQGAGDENAATADEQYETHPLQDRILALISAHELNVDSVIRQVQATPAEVNEAIMALELSGRISRSGNNISRF
jgi:DNA processing protein